MKIMTAQEVREKQRAITEEREVKKDTWEAELLREMLEAINAATEYAINRDLNQPVTEAHIVVEQLPQEYTRWRASGIHSWRPSKLSMHKTEKLVLGRVKAVLLHKFTVRWNTSYYGDSPNSFRTLRLIWSWGEEDK
jgi:hypothetical protein